MAYQFSLPQYPEICKYLQGMATDDKYHEITAQQGSLPEQFTYLWLNNYTSLLNIWFCENFIFPDTINNLLWKEYIYKKIEDLTDYSIANILKDLHPQSIRIIDGKLFVIRYLQEHFNYFVNMFKSYNDEQIMEESLGGQRWNLSIKRFRTIKSGHRTTIESLVKNSNNYPPINLANPSDFSYRDVVEDENNRVDNIIKYLIEFDSSIRQLLIQYGYVPKN